MYPAMQVTQSIFALSCPKVLVLQHWLSPKVHWPGVMFPGGHIHVVSIARDCVLAR
jgi:hypothetical protein